MKDIDTVIMGWNTSVSYTHLKDADAAERYFLARKDKLLEKLEKNCAKHGLFVPDYSVDVYKRQISTRC